jgi:hypothetical protein
VKWSVCHWSQYQVKYLDMMQICQIPWCPPPRAHEADTTVKTTTADGQDIISSVADYVLLSHQVWSWSNQNYSKIKVFVRIMTWPNFDLDIWPWPLSFGMIVTNLLIELYANDNFPEMEIKKVDFLWKFNFHVMTSLNDVITSMLELI